MDTKHLISGRCSHRLLTAWLPMEGAEPRHDELPTVPGNQIDPPRRSTVEQSEVGDSAGHPSHSGREPLLRVSCICCRKLHRVEHPRDFSPICPQCAARRSLMRSLEMDGLYPLRSTSSVAISTSEAAVTWPTRPSQRSCEDWLVRRRPLVSGSPEPRDRAPAVGTFVNPRAASSESGSDFLSLAAIPASRSN